VNSEVQKTRRPRFTLIEAFVVLVILFMVGLRLTVAALVVVLALLYLLFPLHRSRRALWVTSALLALAVLIPFDVYVRSFHGPLFGSKHSGPRMVRVVWGMPMIQRCLDKYGEFISGGCVVRIHDTRWMLVWD
jgi:hypothetical protein